jgi:HEPN domain-containing protein
MARDYAERAQWSLKEAEDALRSEKRAVCVRRSQEGLELASKAVLRRIAIEYPREHDVSEALDIAAQRESRQAKLSPANTPLILLRRQGLW